jgi:hypothetical protein
MSQQRRLPHRSRDGFVTCSAKVEDLALGVIRHRQRRVDDSKAFDSLERIHGYLWEIPGPLGDGLIDLVSNIASGYHNGFYDALSNIVFGGASASEYQSGTSDDGPIATVEDTNRWLFESAPRIQVLLALCNELQITPPDVIYKAAMGRMEQQDTIMDVAGQATKKRDI